MIRAYLPQNAKGLYLDIQKVGCFFRSALYMAELRIGRSLTHTDINLLWDRSKALGYIGTINGEANCVKNSAKIANLALDLYHVKGTFVEVAIKRDGETTFYSGVPMEKRRITDYIQKIRQPGPSKTHFRYVNEDGNLVFEPHDPEITCLGVIYTICYRFDEG